MSGLRLLQSGPALATAAAIALALVALALALEWGRWSGPRRWVRCSVTVLAITSLFVLMAGLSALRVAEREGEAVLWTEGATPELLDEGEGPATPVYALHGRTDTAPAAAVWVADADALDRRAPEVSRWRVVGAGLPSWEWAAVSGRVSSFEPVPGTAGFARAVWSRRVALGSELIVAGEVQSSGDAGAVVLMGPGGECARLELETGGAFELRCRPRRIGRSLYRLRWETDGGADFEELLGVEVHQLEPLRVRWLEGSPAFETRHFKSWFAATGGELAIRTTISRRRRRSEFFGREPASLMRLAPGQLAELDLVVADARSLTSLSRAEAAVLEAAVGDGLGLLVREVEGRLSRVPLLEGLRIATLPGAGELEVRLSLPGGRRSTAITLAGRELEPTPGLRPLLLDTGERILAGVRHHGRGRVAVSLIDDSYRWVLEGAEPSHRAVWTVLLEAVARRREDRTWWIRPGPMLVDEPLEIHRRGSRADLAARVVAPDGTVSALPWRREPGEVGDPGRSSALFYPAAPGWYRMEEGSDELSFHVGDRQAWQAWRSRRSREDTERQKLVSAAGTRVPEGPVEQRVPVSPLLPFGLFLVSAGGLWLDERRTP